MSLKLTREEIIQYREETGCGLHQAKQFLWRQKLTRAIDEALTLEDVRDIMKIWMREL